MGMEAGKQWEYSCSESVQRCWLSNGSCLTALGITGSVGGRMDCRLNIFGFGFVWFIRLKFIDRRSRVGVLEFLEPSMMRISLSHKKLISKQSLVYKGHRSR